jgi:hypothetical protein
MLKSMDTHRPPLPARPSVPPKLPKPPHPHPPAPGARPEAASEHPVHVSSHLPVWPPQPDAHDADQRLVPLPPPPLGPLDNGLRPHSDTLRPTSRLVVDAAAAPPALEPADAASARRPQSHALQPSAGRGPPSKPPRLRPGTAATPPPTTATAATAAASTAVPAVAEEAPRPPKPPRPTTQALADVRDILRAYADVDAAAEGDQAEPATTAPRLAPHAPRPPPRPSRPPPPLLASNSGPRLRIDTAALHTPGGTSPNSRRRSASFTTSRPTSLVLVGSGAGTATGALAADGEGHAPLAAGGSSSGNSHGPYHLKPLPPAPWRPQTQAPVPLPAGARGRSRDDGSGSLRYLDLVRSIQPSASPAHSPLPAVGDAADDPAADGITDDPIFDLVLCVALQSAWLPPGGRMVTTGRRLLTEGCWVGYGRLDAVPTAVYRYPPAPPPDTDGDVHAHAPTKPSTAARARDRTLATLVAAVPQFCFPDAAAVRPAAGASSKLGSETFSFLLTDGDGAKRFGYCRRLWPAPPSHDAPRWPQVYCLVSSKYVGRVGMHAFAFGWVGVGGARASVVWGWFSDTNAPMCVCVCGTQQRVLAVRTNLGRGGAAAASRAGIRAGVPASCRDPSDAAPRVGRP